MINDANGYPLYNDAAPAYTPSQSTAQLADLQALADSADTTMANFDQANPDLAYKGEFKDPQLHVALSHIANPPAVPVQVTASPTSIADLGTSTLSPADGNYSIDLGSGSIAGNIFTADGPGDTVIAGSGTATGTVTITVTA